MNSNGSRNLNNYEIKYQKRLVARELMLKGAGMGAVVIAFIAMQLVYTYAVMFVAGIFIKGEQYNQFVSSLASNPIVLITMPVVTIFLPFLIYGIITKTPVKVSYKKTHLPVDFSISLYFIGMAGAVIANRIAGYIQAFFNLAGIQAESHQYSPPDNLAGMVLFLIGLSVVPALTEEFACRVIAVNSLRRYGDWFAVICSSAVFGLMHGNLIQIPFGFLGGLVFAYIAVRTGNVWLSIAMHLSNNLAAGIIYIVSDYVNEMTAATVMVLYDNLIIIGGVIALIYVIGMKHYSLKLSPSSGLPIGWGRAAAAYLLSPTMILAEIALIAIAILEVIVL